jgi:N-methylhydantoinase A/oxoprolinase/acetone carboxylase beta subunit
VTIALGIDTGGTYTDAVLVDQEHDSLLAGRKALTTYYDLSVGIGRAVAAAFEDQPVSPSDVGLVALSTTLATNAIVEGRGAPVCLLLIGYDESMIRHYGFDRDLVTEDVVYLRGGHDVMGDELAPLDEDAARAAILDRRDMVEAFTVSGYFGVRNPEHEIRLRALIEELTDLPVTCGHELTTRLNAVRRATTATLNAQLIPLLRELIATVRDTLTRMGITAPLMVVRGDGSLARAEWAMQRPIETVLSGPAASVVGASHLAGGRDVWVVDVGGTTTDIATLRDGRPRINPEGVQVGNWRTMIEAVDVRTVGLGGDSEVKLGSEGQLTIGPQRVVPVCLLARDYPGVLDELRRQSRRDDRDGLTGQFVLRQRDVTLALSDRDRALLDDLATGPKSLMSLVERLRYRRLVVRQVRDLERRRLVLRSGFTPTDALHVLGRFERWDGRASQAAAELLASEAHISVRDFCEQVISGVSDRAATELVSKVLSDEIVPPDWAREPVAAGILARGLGNVPYSDLACRLTLRQPLVAVGAPVAVFMPRVSEQLNTELVIPPHADVANALGAVAGGVVQELRALIRPLEADEFFRLHLPDGVQDFATVEEAVAHAESVMPAQVEALARRAGAVQVEIKLVRLDREVPVAEAWGQPIYLDTQLVATAVGRPSLA